MRRDRPEWTSGNEIGDHGSQYSGLLVVIELVGSLGLSNFLDFSGNLVASDCSCISGAWASRGYHLILAVPCIWTENLRA